MQATHSSHDLRLAPLAAIAGSEVPPHAYDKPAPEGARATFLAYAALATLVPLLVVQAARLVTGLLPPAAQVMAGLV